MALTLAGFLFCLLLSLYLAVGGYFLASFFCRLTGDGVVHALNDAIDYFKPKPGDYVEQRRKRQIEIIMSSSGVVGMANVSNAILLMVILLANGAGLNVLWWGATIILMSIFHFSNWLRLRNKVLSVEASRRILRRVVVNAALFGFVTGAGMSLFYEQVNDVSKVVILLSLAGVLAGATAALGSVPPAALAFCVFLSMHVFFALFRTDGALETSVAILTGNLLITFGAISAGVYAAAIKRPALKALGRDDECAGPACTLRREPEAA